MHVSCVHYNQTSAFVRRTGILKLASVVPYANVT